MTARATQGHRYRWRGRDVLALQSGTKRVQVALIMSGLGQSVYAPSPYIFTGEKKGFKPPLRFLVLMTQRQENATSTVVLIANL